MIAQNEMIQVYFSPLILFFSFVGFYFVFSTIFNRDDLSCHNFILENNSYSIMGFSSIFSPLKTLDKKRG